MISAALKRQDNFKKLLAVELLAVELLAVELLAFEVPAFEVLALGLYAIVPRNPWNQRLTLI